MAMNELGRSSGGCTQRESLMSNWQRRDLIEFQSEVGRWRWQITSIVSSARHAFVKPVIKPIIDNSITSCRIVRGRGGGWMFHWLVESVSRCTNKMLNHFCWFNGTNVAINRNGSPDIPMSCFQCIIAVSSSHSVAGSCLVASSCSVINDLVPFQCENGCLYSVQRNRLEIVVQKHLSS